MRKLRLVVLCNFPQSDTTDLNQHFSTRANLWPLNTPLFPYFSPESILHIGQSGSHMWKSSSEVVSEAPSIQSKKEILLGFDPNSN